MFLKNKNIIFKIRRSKVTDYAALTNMNHLFMGLLEAGIKEARPRGTCAESKG